MNIIVNSEEDHGNYTTSQENHEESANAVNCNDTQESANLLYQTEEPPVHGTTAPQNSAGNSIQGGFHNQGIDHHDSEVFVSLSQQDSIYQGLDFKNNSHNLVTSTSERPNLVNEQQHKQENNHNQRNETYTYLPETRKNYQRLIFQNAAQGMDSENTVENYVQDLSSLAEMQEIVHLQSINNSNTNSDITYDR